MFRGLNSVILDDKGRIAIPARYRSVLTDEFESQLVVTIDTEFPCLLLYPASRWEEIERKLGQLPTFHPETRRIQRLLIGHATEVEMDRVGRVLIPPILRDYAHLTKTIVLVGQGQKFEVWSETSWEKARAQWLTGTTSPLPEELSTLAL